jgi:L-ribulokinase
VTSKYTIGVDYGTESGRVLLFCLDSGEEVADSEVRYPSVVIDERLPGTGEELPLDWALQDPADYLHVLETGVPEVLERSGVPAAKVVGIGLDVTCCTVLPVDGAGTPLSQLEGWRARPHAWCKLWKHHAAQRYADRLNEVAVERGEQFLARYGGRLSSEWYFPKLIQVWSEDREVYEGMAAFVEATDWIVWQLTGELRRSSCPAGYKACWSPRDGLPSRAFFGAAFPGFPEPDAKLGSTFFPPGSRAGSLGAAMAARIGLRPGTAVAVGNVDSFASVPGAGVDQPGQFVMMVGTSICDMTIHPNEVLLPGVTGVVQDGIFAGSYGYEAGQAAVGDMFAWFVDRLLGERDTRAARYQALEAEAATIRPGGTGLVALDWWNGNRSILGDADLSGVIAGLTLSTTPAEVYRALLESVALGTLRIIDNFEEHGLPQPEIVACGGVALRSPLLMQLIADVTNRPVRVPASSQVPARGSALFAAVAAGEEAGGFPDIASAVRAHRPGTAASYSPDPVASGTYQKVYTVYRELYGLLGRERAEWLHTLKQLSQA